MFVCVCKIVIGVISYIQISTKSYTIQHEEIKNKRESKKKSERFDISIRHYKIVLIYIDN